jgi:hypothetical protein
MDKYDPTPRHHDELPAGTFQGDDEIPPGTFH